MNPLLDFSGLPKFGDIRPGNVEPAIERLLAEAREALAAVTQPDVPVRWEEFIAPLEDANERLARAWGQVSHLHAVLDSPELREAYNAALPRVTQYWTELGQNQPLFEKYRALRASAEFDQLAPARKRVVHNALRDFRLGGAELPTGEKRRFAQIQEELASLSARFSENVLDATNAFSLTLEDASRVAGIPADELSVAREAAQKDGKQGWKFTLHAPSYVPVMQYAADRAVREAMYRESVTRASEFGKPEWDNTPLIERILSLRAQEAKLLGYANYAERSLVPKMADSPAQVLGFLDDLARRAHPFAERDAAELKDFARSEIGIECLEAWDVAFASEKLRSKRYAFSDQDVKQYFAETDVVPGMFRLVETLYGVRFAEASAATWHEDVRFFEVRDASGALIGQFYLDLYARDTKRGGAWMDDAIGRRRKGAVVQTPVTYLNCNFARPVGAKPALFTQDEVITLFHEFGHGLHHLLTRADYLGVSGLHGVEWDAVELPSQFMENFCWEWEVLAHMTRHVDTNQPLPRSLFDKMVAAKNFQAGLGMLRQIEFSLFDMHLHFDFGPGSSALELLDAVRKRVAVLFLPAYNRFPNNFSHIFAGGYAAGYYSYKWAEVLSADAFSAFEERRGADGVLDARTARVSATRCWQWRKPPRGGIVSAPRGREPSVDALLRHNGMIAA